MKSHLSLLLAASTLATWADVIYVNPGSVSGGNNGDSWKNAFLDLKDGLAMAKEEDEVWIAQGTYLPGSPSNRAGTYTIANGVEVYGGFDGETDDFSARNPTAFPTILSGEGGTSGALSDNVYTVVTITGNAEEVLLDGVTITNGYANSSSQATGDEFQNYGGGLFLASGSAVIRNCLFVNNVGTRGGALATLTAGAVTLEDCRFEGNTALQAGGAIYSEVSLQIDRCSFRGNTASAAPDGTGGAVVTNTEPSTYRNCLFSGNTARLGGALFIDEPGVESRLINCTIVANEDLGVSPSVTSPGIVSTGGGLAAPGGLVRTRVINGLIWGNRFAASGPLSASRYVSTLIEGEARQLSSADGSVRLHDGTAGGLQPRFIAPLPESTSLPSVGGNYRLRGSSDVINLAGNPPGTDLDRKPRTPGPADLGAYEAELIYVDANADGAATGLSWEDAYPFLGTALASAGEWAAIWVAGGTYYPTAGTDRSVSFTLPLNVSLHGGFESGASHRSQRDQEDFPSILSGDIGVSGSTDDNSFHVLDLSPADENSVVHGFVIQDGNADEEGHEDHSRGGGVSFRGTGTAPDVENCIIRGNHALNNGGGAFFSGDGRTLKITNCVFSGNSSKNGAAIAQQDLKTGLINCTLVANSADTGAALYLAGSSSCELVNCIVWGNRSGARTSNVTLEGGTIATYSHTLVEGMYPPGPGNVDGTPATSAPTFHEVAAALEAPTISGNYRLTATSVGNELGINSANPLSKAIGGTPRIKRRIDLGAYENNLIWYVSKAGNDFNSGGTWDDSFASVEEAISSSRSGDSIWVAAGVYKPGEILKPKPGTTLYGGFPAGGASFEFRNPGANETILSGERQDDTTTDDNLRHVFQLEQPGDSTPLPVLLEGFIIQDGYAQARFSEVTGGPLDDDTSRYGPAIFIGNRVLATIRDCVIRDNRGFESYAVEHRGSNECRFENTRFENNRGIDFDNRAVLNSSTSSTSLDLSRCDFIGNDGIAASFQQGDLVEITNCRFIDNLQGIFMRAGDIRFTNCLFSESVVSLERSAGTFINCSFVSSSATPVLAWQIMSTAVLEPVEFLNCLAWGNDLPDGETTVSLQRFSNFPVTPATFSHCLFEGEVLSGMGNLDGTLAANDPLFLDPTVPGTESAVNGDFRLAPGSPARNAGLDSANPEPFDLSGIARIEGTIDLGAYEYFSTLTVGGGLHDDSDGDGVSNGIERAIGSLLGSSDPQNNRRLGLMNSSSTLSFGVDEAEQTNLILKLVRSTDLNTFPVTIASNECGPYTVPASGILSVTDPDPPAGSAFYRLEVTERDSP